MNAAAALEARCPLGRRELDGLLHFAPWARTARVVVTATEPGTDKAAWNGRAVVHQADLASSEYD